MLCKIRVGDDAEKSWDSRNSTVAEKRRSVLCKVEKSLTDQVQAKRLIIGGYAGETECFEREWRGSGMTEGSDLINCLTLNLGDGRGTVGGLNTLPGCCR